MYCDKVIELLKELERSREDTIPPYNVLVFKYTIDNLIQILYILYRY